MKNLGIRFLQIIKIALCVLAGWMTVGLFIRYQDTPLEVLRYMGTPLLLVLSALGLERLSKKLKQPS